MRRFDRYLDNINKLKDQHPSNLIILHINICSITTKFQFVEAILNTKNVDILFVSETFLDEDTPESKFRNIYYNTTLRRDRTKRGGGLFVFIRKGYVVREIERSLDFESIVFSIGVESAVYKIARSRK